MNEMNIFLLPLIVGGLIGLVIYWFTYFLIMWWLDRDDHKK